MCDEIGQQQLQEMEQRCATMRGQVVDALRVTGGPESAAPRVERAQEDQDAEMTATHARSGVECSKFLLVEASCWVDDVSVSMKRRAEKVSSPEDESLEIVTLLVSLDLGSVLVNFNVAELFCEDRFGDAAVDRVCCAAGWDIEDEEQTSGVRRRDVDEKHGIMFDELFERMQVTGRYLCRMPQESRRHEEREENEMSSAKMDKNRGRFLGKCLVSRTQRPVPKHSDRLLEVRVLRDEDVESVALWNWERDENCIIRWVDDAASDESAMLTKIDRYEEQFVFNKFQRLVTTVHEEQSGIVFINAREKIEFGQNPECTVVTLRDCYCNRDSCTHLVSVHCRRFAVKDERKERVRWQVLQVWQGVARTSSSRRTRQDHADEPSVPARNESELSGGRHSCRGEARQVGWQNKGVIKLMFRDEGFRQDHRTAVLGQCAERQR